MINNLGHTRGCSYKDEPFKYHAKLLQILNEASQGHNDTNTQKSFAKARLRRYFPLQKLLKILTIEDYFFVKDKYEMINQDDIV